MVKLSAKERIEKVVSWTGLSTNAFAAQVGLPSPQSLYQIKGGKHNISRTIAELICSRYPEIDLAWLLAGEGEMLKGTMKPLPYYGENCSEVLLHKSSLTPLGYVTMVGCCDCDFVAPCNSAAMEPTIKQGSLLFCKRCEVGDVAAGVIVVVSNGQVAVVRRVKEIGESELRLEADAQGVPPTIFDTTQVRECYLVTAVLGWKII